MLLMSRVHLNRKRGVCMKVLITGVNGFIGSNIYNELKIKHNVLGISQSSTSNVCNQYICCDLTDRYKLEEVIKQNNDIDAIIHCAALAHNKGNDLSKDRFMNVNYEATKCLVDFSNQYLNLKQFIFLSTISVYGERMDKDIYTEGDECCPKSPYAVAKKKSEEYIISNCKAFYYILRLSPVYGNEFDLNIKRRTEIRGINYIVGNGDNKLSLCNIKNIVYTVDNVLYGNIKENEIYNVSDKKEYLFSDMLNLNRVSKIKIYVPKLIISTLYNINRVTIKKPFIEENSIKLLSSSIYCSEKLRQYINLGYELN